YLILKLFPVNTCKLFSYIELRFLVMFFMPEVLRLQRTAYSISSSLPDAMRSLQIPQALVFLVISPH
ncbi:MAG: hypothetical protein ACKOPK_01435, partial [Dolichospermum sp.]